MSGLVAVVFMRWGRWIARCPRPGCANAECYGNDDAGDVGGLAGSFRCRLEKGGCGLQCDALWPEHVEDIERLLLARPVPATRNWEPGEDLVGLLAENIQHGIVPVTHDAIEAGRGGERIGRLLTIGPDGISGELAGATALPALPSGRRA